MESKEYSAGDLIIAEGTKGEEIFIIKEGEVRIFKKINQEKIELVVLGKDEFFGEMSLFLGIPRSASVEAITQTKVDIYDKPSFLELIKNEPDFTYSILKKMAERLQNSNNLVTKLEGIKRSYEIMYNKI